MTPADLSLTVLRAVRSAVDDGALTVAGDQVPDVVRVERPRPGGLGDYASNVALTLARAAHRPPLDVAAILRDRLHPSPGIAAVDITGPGFLNFTLRRDARHDLVREILRRGDRYGRLAPTGDVAQPVHRADVRAAVTADAVRRILVSQGYAVRTACEDAADPAWADLGVRIEAQDARGRLATDIAPLPVPYTATELLRRFGRDAARWGLLCAAAHDRAPLDDLLLRQHESNPLFRVRYAHARARGLTRNAARLGFGSRPPQPRAHQAEAPTATPADYPAGPPPELPAQTPPAPQAEAPAGPSVDPAPQPPADTPPHPLGDPLLRALGDHPAVLAVAARHRAPDRVARHLEVVADALLDFQHTVLPLGDEKPSAAHRSRLALAEAAGVVLAGGLSLLGISAPDQI
ncbi:ArgS-related anticodon-binding protein NrtL [Streptomyces sp. NPDC090127]|uniref:ArgS-related anticodon-binding protein NrtL n=1 Tax=Streptomyces sp. NPDC090127 TaxID=3365953 RepID=UPI0038289FB5